ncbi:MAG: CBS domain-containing protein [Rhodospirillaceae bacterium]|nr:MAG: CBS domain-containing protein [Rhodospirillaceae bacterium]
MYVSDVMSSNVICVHAESRIVDAIRLMLDKHIGGVPVVDGGGKVVGMVTEGDLMRRAEIGTQKQHASWLSWLVSDAQRAQDYFHSHTQRVSDVMTADVISVSPTTPLDQAVALIEKNRVKRLPVLREGRVIGILARADVLRAIMRQLAADTDPTDAEIGLRVEEELKKQPWAPLEMVDVTVRSGVVELRGTVTDPRFKDALRVLAENVPGVVGVKDYLIWAEPATGVALGPAGELW